MELMNYWPSQEHIWECIRSEAEELTETTLLAVHEPMVLRRDGVSHNDSALTNEDQLLAEFIKSERPLPIIGRSGVGKSHLIRWLAAKLVTHPESKDWHIVRIPKNASLPVVLEKLLDGLEGELFEDARSKIHQIGEKKDVWELAEDLLLEMGQQLTKMEAEAKSEGQMLRSSGQLTREKSAYLQARVKHCGRNGLRVMLNDPEFKEKFFLKPEHCISQFAKRLLKGTKGEVLKESDYIIHGSDIDFGNNLELEAASALAAKYVRNNRLNSDEQVRDEVADILNEVLGSAIRAKFEQMFRYKGGTFQDLFKEIRQYLHHQGRTLVVLVEDMAAISAIEDVLIDSLLEEGIRDGERTLCPLRSAIAVTDGYPGYVRRQGTIKTRAKAEWWIEESSDDQQLLMQRIINFCGRYLNAARFGSEELAKRYSPDKPWPPVWHHAEEEPESLHHFGQAERPKIPLFPFNPNAIEVMVKHYCLNDHGQLQFNPRLVIQSVLQPILRDSEQQVRNGTFPHAEFAGVKAEMELQSELITIGIDDLPRALSLAAIWGGRAANLEQLRQRLPAQVAEAFGLSELAQQLSDTVVTPPVKPEPATKPPRVTRERELKPKPTPPIAAPTPKEPYVAEVDDWLQNGKQLGQSLANKLRKALRKQLELNLDELLVASKLKKSLVVSRTFMCSIPNANGNSNAMQLGFFDPKMLKDPYSTAAIRQVTLGLLRWADANDGNDLGFGYAKGGEDYVAIKDFITQWLPAQLPKLIESRRDDKLESAIQKHLKLAYQLALIDPAMSTDEKLNQLLLTAQDLQTQSGDSYRSGLETLRLSNARDIDRAFIAKAIDGWEAVQQEWLELVNSQNRAIEGDLIKRALSSAQRKLSAIPDTALAQQIRRSQQDIAALEAAVGLFSGYTTKEGLDELIEHWLEVLTQLKRADKYPAVAQVTYPTVRGKVKELMEAPYWQLIKAVRLLSQKTDPQSQWVALQELPLEFAEKFQNTISYWSEVERQISSQLAKENAQGDAKLVAEARQQTQGLLNQARNDLYKIAGER